MRTSIRAPQAALSVAFFFMAGCASTYDRIVSEEFRQEVAYHGAFRTEAARIGPVHYLSVYSYLPGSVAPKDPARILAISCGSHKLYIRFPTELSDSAQNIASALCDAISGSETLLNAEVSVGAFDVRLVDPEAELESETARIGFRPRFAIAFHIGNRVEEDIREAARILSHELFHVASRFSTGRQLHGYQQYFAEEFDAVLFEKCVELKVFRDIDLNDLPRDSYTSGAENFDASISAGNAVRLFLAANGVTAEASVEQRSKALSVICSEAFDAYDG